MVLCALLLCGVACVKRPPPIRSGPGAPSPEGPPACPVTEGIDPRGDPACAPGCLWDQTERQCVPDPTATPPDPAGSSQPAGPAAPAPPPVPAVEPPPGQPLPQLPPPTKQSPSLPPSDGI